MKYSFKRIAALLCTMLCVFTISAPTAQAVEQFCVSTAPPVEQTETRGTFPPEQLFGTHDLSGGGQYSFAGNTYGGTLYTDYRFKGKTTYMVKLTQVSSPLTVSVYKDGFLADPPTYITSFTFTSSGAIMSFGASSTNDEFWLKFTSNQNCNFAGYVY